MGPWFVHFIGGLLPWVTKPFGEWFGKILFYGVIIAIALTVYHKVFEPKSVTKIEKIETQVINQCPEELKWLGLKLNVWKFKIGAGI